MSDPLRLPPFAALRAFEAYGRTNGVRRAAQDLGVSHAIVSRHLRALELWLGVALIDRGRGRLTVAGQEYHAGIAAGFAQIAGATRALVRDPERRIEIWCVPGLAYLWLMTKLAAFRRLHPTTAIDLRPSDTAADVAHGEADVDIRYVRDGEPELPTNAAVRSEVLVRPRIFPVASPRLIESRARDVARPTDLASLPLLHEDNDLEWRGWFAAHDASMPVLPARARLWHAHLAIGAAVEGDGVALANRYLAGGDLDAGRLVEVGHGDPAFRAVALGAYRLTIRRDRVAGNVVMQFRRWLIDSLHADAQAASAEH